MKTKAKSRTSRSLTDQVPQAMRHHAEKVHVFKLVDQTPARLRGTLCPQNLEQEKERFLKHGILPKFNMRGSQEAVAKAANRERGQIRLELFKEAKNILDFCKKKFGDGDIFIEENYGRRMGQEGCTISVAEYLEENNLEGQMTVYWSNDLTCSARMVWQGPHLRCNKPERRKFSLLIKNASDNNYLRETGITCLMDHEIGTHYFRMVNDGFQPWYSDRKRFGLRSGSCRESVSTEEGLATVNTLLNANTKYLFSAALLYYASCKAITMSFRELFDHLGQYVNNPDVRWRHVMRIKRGLKDPNEVGGYGNDQCYFEGAVEILRNIENIDFFTLYSGRICIDEIQRIKRMARTNCLKIPKFLRDIEKYKRTLRQIGYLNMLIPKPEKIMKPIPKTKSEPNKSKPWGSGCYEHRYEPKPPCHPNPNSSRNHSSVAGTSSQDKQTDHQSISRNTRSLEDSLVYLVEEELYDTSDEGAEDQLPERLLLRPRKRRILIKRKKKRLREL